MRAPELQLIDRLEKLKTELKNFAPAIAISLSEYQRNLFSALKDKISKSDTTDANNTKKQIDFIRDALTITLNLVNILIAKATPAAVSTTVAPTDSSDSDSDAEDTARIREKGLEQLVHSLCAEHAQNEEIAPVVMTAFVSILKDYRESIEKICNAYDLAMPIDNTPVVADFSDDYFHVDGKVTLFRLQEIQYMLEKMLNATPDELSRLHPIRALPYMRYMQLSDEIVDRIQLSKQKLTERLGDSIKEVQNKLLSIMSANNYPETAVTSKDIAAQQTQLLVEIESGIAALGRMRSQMQVSGTLEALLANMAIVQSFQDSVRVLLQRLTECRVLDKVRMRVDFEFNGTDVSMMPAVAASSGVLAQELGMRSREESRFGIVNEIVSGLIANMNRLQVSAGESTSDFGLKDYLRDLKDQVQSFDQTMLQFQNTMKLQTLTQQLNGEVKAFVEYQQDRRPQAQAAATSTTSAVALFRSPNTTAYSNSSRADENNTQMRRPDASNQGCAQQ